MNATKIIRKQQRQIERLEAEIERLRGLRWKHDPENKRIKELRAVR